MNEGFEGFLELKLNSITVNSIFGFDLYIKNALGPQLYRNRNISISNDDIMHLAEYGHEYLYVPKSQEAYLNQYFEQNLPNILNDKTVSIETKLELLTSTSTRILKEVFNDPGSSQNLGRILKQSENHVKMALTDAATAHKMATKKIDASYPIVHAINVGNFSILLGLRCNITEPDKLKELNVGAVLHEIGKIIIDKNFYFRNRKNGHISNNRLKNYPLIGMKMLHKSKIVNKSALLAVLEHQERLDGSGFPQKKYQDQISTEGRIVAICDYFCEATQNKNHNKFETPFQVLNRMMNLPDKFDSKILKEFIYLLGETNISVSAGAR